MASQSTEQDRILSELTKIPFTHAFLERSKKPPINDQLRKKSYLLRIAQTVVIKRPEEVFEQVRSKLGENAQDGESTQPFTGSQICRPLNSFASKTNPYYNRPVAGGHEVILNDTLPS